MQINSSQSLAAVQQTARTGSVRGPSPLEAAATNQVQTGSVVDQLDFSAEAQALMSAQGGEGEMRLDRIATIRQAISDGSYETPEKLDAALEKLLDSFA